MRARRPFAVRWRSALVTVTLSRVTTRRTPARFRARSVFRLSLIVNRFWPAAVSRTRTVPTVRLRPRPSFLASLRATVSLALPAQAESQRIVKRARPLVPVRGRVIAGAVLSADVGGGVTLAAGSGAGAGPTSTLLAAVSVSPWSSWTVTTGWKVPVLA